MMRHIRPAAAISIASSLLLGACGPAADHAPTDPLGPAATSATARVHTADSPQGRSVLAAMENFKQAILASDTTELARIWLEGYTFINPQGAIVTRAQRLANIGSGSTDVQIIENEREITVRVFGNTAVVQNLSTLRGSFSGQPTDTDLRGTFVWLRHDGRWRLVTNQLTPVAH